MSDPLKFWKNRSGNSRQNGGCAAFCPVSTLPDEQQVFIPLASGGLLPDTMFGSATLDLAVGMVFVFLMLSFVVSAVREAIEARLKDRAKHLAHGLFELLGDEQLVEKLYTHPLISALYDGKFDRTVLAYKGHRFFSWIPALVASLSKSTSMPSYIPARTLALALVDMARTGQLHPPPDAPGEANAAAAEVPEEAVAQGPMLMDELRAHLQTQKASPVARALLAALAAVGNDNEKGLEAIQKWYDGAMDRVSGWFKRESQHILFWLGVFVAVSLNVDSIYLAKFLAANPEARNHLVQTAMNVAEKSQMSETIDALRAPPAPAKDSAAPPSSPTPGDLVGKLREADVKVSNAIRTVTDLNLPLGWNHTRWNDFRVGDVQTYWTVLGWLVTAFALSFGAPFWFDLLNKIMVIRSTVKPHEKSPEEASVDRQKNAI